MVYIPYVNEALSLVGNFVSQCISKPEVKVQPPIPVISFDSMIVRIAGLSGALAVLASAYGAHGFDVNHEKERQIFKTGAYYHLVHSVALMGTPMARHPTLTASLMVSGMLLFSGSCYCVALSGNERLSKPVPIGGMVLVFAWLSLVL